MALRTASTITVVVLILIALAVSPVCAQYGQPAVYSSISDLLAANHADGTPVELDCKPILAVNQPSAYGNYFVAGEDYTSETIKIFYTGNVETSQRISRASGQIQTLGSERVICIDCGPNFNASGYKGSLLAAFYPTIAYLKCFSDLSHGALPIDIEFMVVTRTFPGLGYFYIRSEDEHSGMRVYDSVWSSYLNPGDLISIYGGTFETVDGERVINSWSTVPMGQGASPQPISMNNSAVGGGSYNIYTPGPEGGRGVHNIGAFVRTWGKVTASGIGWFYIDDGSNLNDGSGNVGLRVAGCFDYIPHIGDYVVVSGIVGLNNIAGKLEKVLRVASSEDIIPPSSTRHPMNPMAISTGSGKISIYWDGVLGAHSYNVYRGTSPGGEDYNNPINPVPITTPTYSGGNVFMFTDTGRENGVTYYYTVKSVGVNGLSAPSAEVSEVPSPDAVPWDTVDVSQIISAIQNQLPQSASNIRAVGPDGRVYVSGQSSPQMPDGIIMPGSDMIKLASGRYVPAPNDGGDFGYDTAPSGLNASDCAYRRVVSTPGYTGALGDLYLPGGGSVFLTPGYIDTPYIYFGSRSGNPGISVNAGLCWYSGRKNWEVFQTSCIKSSPSEQRVLLNYYSRDLRNFAVGASVSARYQIIPQAAMSAVTVSGVSSQFDYQSVCVVNACPVKKEPARIKRVHAIVQGGPPWVYTPHGSYMLGADALGMKLLDDQSNQFDWTSGSTSEQGSYSGGSSVTWRVLNAYTDEDQINLDR